MVDWSRGCWHSLPIIGLLVVDWGFGSLRDSFPGNFDALSHVVVNICRSDVFDICGICC